MNPAVVIPTYWSSSDHLGNPGGVQCYDHATPIDSDHPQLDLCLASLKQVLGLKTVIILVTAPPAVEERAVRRVRELADKHQLQDAIIVDSFKAMMLNEKIAGEMPPNIGEPISLRGYGAIRNMGLLACCALGCDVAVFIDDDETILDENFLVNAVYGFGQIDRNGLPIIAKSGYFLDRRNSALADRRTVKFYDKFWAKRAEFNEWMTQALAGPRISRSNVVCGGCFAVHAEAFTRVAFDPWITRGEDLDYLINMRLYGMDVWFDNKWRVRHTPPRIQDTAPRFLQDVYRWTYERRKIEICNSNIDMHMLTPEALMPYPGPWISAELPVRIRKTAYWRAAMTNEKAAYWQIYRQGRKDAEAYAEQNCANYLHFQQVWPVVTAMVWQDEGMQRVLRGAGMLMPAIAARMAQRAGMVSGAPDGSGAAAGVAGAGAAEVGVGTGAFAAAGAQADWGEQSERDARHEHYVPVASEIQDALAGYDERGAADASGAWTVDGFGAAGEQAAAMSGADGFPGQGAPNAPAMDSRAGASNGGAPMSDDMSDAPLSADDLASAWGDDGQDVPAWATGSQPRVTQAAPAPVSAPAASSAPQPRDGLLAGEPADQYPVSERPAGVPAATAPRTPRPAAPAPAAAAPRAPKPAGPAPAPAAPAGATLRPADAPASKPAAQAPRPADAPAPSDAE